MHQPSLLSLDSSLRLVQQTSGGAMCGPLCFQRGLKFCDARLEYCGWIIIAPTIQNDDRDPAILHEAVAWTHLVSALLRRLAGWALEAQGATHAVFSRLCVAR